MEDLYSAMSNLLSLLTDNTDSPRQEQMHLIHNTVNPLTVVFSVASHTQEAYDNYTAVLKLFAKLSVGEEGLTQELTDAITLVYELTEKHRKLMHEYLFEMYKENPCEDLKVLMNQTSTPTGMLDITRIRM